MQSMPERIPVFTHLSSAVRSALLVGVVGFTLSCSFYAPRPTDHHAIRTELISFTQQESHFALWETAEVPPEELSLPEAAAIALSNNHELRSRYMRFESLLRQAPRSGALPDPIPDIRDVEVASRQSNLRATMVVVSQRFPSFGKRSLRRAVSEKKALENLDRYRISALDLRRRLARAWYNLAYVEELRELEEEEALLTARTRGVLRAAGYTVREWGAPARGQYLATADPGELREEILELIGVDDARFSPAFPPTETTMEPLPQEAELLLTASHNRPELDRHARLMRIGDLSSRLARREPLPDFAVGISYATVGDAATGAPTPLIEGHGDAWEASAGISIPLPGPRQRQAKEAARRATDKAREDYVRTEREIHAEIQHLLARLGMLQQEILALEYTEIPDAANRYEAEMINQEGPSDETLLGLEERLLNGRRRLLEARREYYFTLSDLDRAVGVPL